VTKQIGMNVGGGIGNADLLSFQANPEDKSSKRAQRPKMMVSFEPFGFIKVGSARGDQGVRGELELVPLPFVALDIIGQWHPAFQEGGALSH